MLHVLRRAPALVGLLVALLSLSLVVQVAQPSPALAAEPASPVACDGTESACSPWVEVRNDGYTDGGLYWQKCAGSARWVVSRAGVSQTETRIEIANLKCRGFSPAREALHNSEGDAQLTLAGCTPAYTESVSWLDGDGYNYTPRQLTSPLDTDCQPTRWEVSIESTNGPLPSNTIKDGGPLNLPAKPSLGSIDRGETCPYGTPRTAQILTMSQWQTSQTKFTFKATAEPSAPFAPPSGKLWYILFNGRKDGGGWSLIESASTLQGPATASALNHEAYRTGLPPQWSNVGGHGIRVDAIVTPGAPPENDYLSAYPDLSQWANANPGHVLPVTDPSACRFYFGEKVWSDGIAGSGLDEPMGASDGSEPGTPGVPDSPAPDPVVDDTPAEDDVSACHFDVTDPSSWLEAGMCAVVGILKLIWETLGDVLGAIRDLGGLLVDAIAGIAQAILDGLGALFVPSESALTAGVNAVKQAWADSSPGQYLSAFGGIAGAFDGLSAGGCEGPRLQASTGLGDIDVRPFNACDGTMATIAGIVKIALAAGVYLGAGVIAVRVIGASFGLNLNGLGREGGNE
ncbi:MAG TPA: hypothetical protein VHM23_10720 [Actinomycetota bacterium]|nr:hypothetical protein [Actinomycetota bacterium]